jgi:hypothetical protein
MKNLVDDINFDNIFDAPSKDERDLEILKNSPQRRKDTNDEKIKIMMNHKPQSPLFLTKAEIYQKIVPNKQILPEIRHTKYHSIDFNTLGKADPNKNTHNCHFYENKNNLEIKCNQQILLRNTNKDSKEGQISPKYEIRTKKVNYIKHEKNTFSVKITNLTKSLNKELGRISHNYGKIQNLKRFTANPKTQFYYDNHNYLAYRTAKVVEDKDQFRPKWKNLMIEKDCGKERMAHSIFNLKKSFGSAIQEFREGLKY